MGYFECCNGCVAPKRHVGCHGTCKEYKDAKTEYDAQQAEFRATREAEEARNIYVKRRFGAISHDHRQRQKR